MDPPPSHPHLQSHNNNNHIVVFPRKAIECQWPRATGGHVDFKSDHSFSLREVRLVLPKPPRTEKLLRGQMGYARFGLRDPREGDPGINLIFHKDVGKDIIIPALAAGGQSKSMLYASVHPDEEDGFEQTL